MARIDRERFAIDGVANLTARTTTGVGGGRPLNIRVRARCLHDLSSMFLSAKEPSACWLFKNVSTAPIARL